MAMAMAPKMSISGELMAAARTERRLARNSRSAASRKRTHLPELHAEGLHDAVAGDGLVQNVLDLGQLVLSVARGVRTRPPILRRRIDDDGNEQQQHPGQLAAQQDDHERGEDKGEELLQELRHHGRHGVLHPLDVIDDRGQQGAGGVLLKESRRAPQNGVVRSLRRSVIMPKPA